MYFQNVIEHFLVLLLIAEVLKKQMHLKLR